MLFIETEKKGKIKGKGQQNRVGVNEDGPWGVFFPGSVRFCALIDWGISWNLRFILDSRYSDSLFIREKVKSEECHLKNLLFLVTIEIN